MSLLFGAGCPRQVAPCDGSCGGVLVVCSVVWLLQELWVNVNLAWCFVRRGGLRVWLVACLLSPFGRSSPGGSVVWLRMQYC
jgi:hypothetical protein